MNTNNSNISTDISDIPKLQIRTVSLFKGNGTNLTFKIADASKLGGEGIRANLGDQTLKALLRKPKTIRLPDVRGILGSKMEDRMTGSAANELFVGKGGKDIIRAAGGNDVLIGSGQGDVLFGEAGSDVLFGDGLSLYLQNGLPADDAKFNPGLLALSKGGKDLLLGGGGADFLAGGVLGDTLKGGSGNDKLIGESGTDVLSGGKNNDVLVGGQAVDELTGGEGKDSFVYVNPKEGGDRITDFNPVEDRFVVFGSNFRKDLFDSEAPNLLLRSKARMISEEQFRIGASAKDRDDRFIYDKRTGTLSFDFDGSGLKKAQVLAKLDGKPTLTFADIFST